MHPQLEHHTIIELDVVGSGSRSPRRSRELRSDLRGIVRDVLRRQGISFDDIERKDQGDGTRLLFPAKYPPTQIVGPFISDLGTLLREHRRRAAPEARIRLRVAAHHGAIYRDEEGWDGEPLRVVARLLEADPLRQAVADHAEADFALLISQEMHREVILDGYGPRPEEFQPVRADVKEMGARRGSTLPE